MLISPCFWGGAIFHQASRKSRPWPPYIPPWRKTPYIALFRCRPIDSHHRENLTRSISMRKFCTTFFGRQNFRKFFKKNFQTDTPHVGLGAKMAGTKRSHQGRILGEDPRSRAKKYFSPEPGNFSKFSIFLNFSKTPTKIQKSWCSEGGTVILWSKTSQKWSSQCQGDIQKRSEIFSHTVHVLWSISCKFFHFFSKNLNFESMCDFSLGCQGWVPPTPPMVFSRVKTPGTKRSSDVRLPWKNPMSKKFSHAGRAWKTTLNVSAPWRTLPTRLRVSTRVMRCKPVVKYGSSSGLMI